MSSSQYLRLAIHYQAASIHFKTMGCWVLADHYREVASHYLALADLEAR